MHSCNPRDILAIHASAVCVGQKALIFIGASGAGKSTICQLLSPHAKPLADDRVYLIPLEKGRWAVADASADKPPKVLSRRDAFALETVPLCAVFSIEQSPESRIESMEVLEVCRALTQGFVDIPQYILLDVECKKVVFFRLASVARDVVGHRLYFNLTPDTFQVISEVVG